MPIIDVIISRVGKDDNVVTSKIEEENANGITTGVTRRVRNQPDGKRKTPCRAPGKILILLIPRPVNILYHEGCTYCSFFSAGKSL